MGAATGTRAGCLHCKAMYSETVFANPFARSRTPVRMACRGGGHFAPIRQVPAYKADVSQAIAREGTLQSGTSHTHFLCMCVHAFWDTLGCLVQREGLLSQLWVSHFMRPPGAH